MITSTKVKNYIDKTRDAGRVPTFYGYVAEYGVPPKHELDAVAATFLDELLNAAPPAQVYTEYCKRLFALCSGEDRGRDITILFEGNDADDCV